uniref:Uncharacterized protein n=1 Tax=Populus trichocarpa TaxID=3694 RepID=U5FKU6_POPTR
MIITLHRYCSITQTLNHLPSGCPRTRCLFHGGKKVAFKLWRMDAFGKMRKFEAFLWLRFSGTCVQLHRQIFVSLGGCFGGDKNILKVITLLIN